MWSSLIIQTLSIKKSGKEILLSYKKFVKTQVKKTWMVVDFTVQKISMDPFGSLDLTTRFDVIPPPLKCTAKITEKIIDFCIGGILLFRIKSQT